MEFLRKILIIDNDPTTGFLHKRLLEEYWVAQKVEVAYSGEEALQLIQYYNQILNEDHLPQLILVDLNMPYMDVFEFLEAYQDLDFKIKDLIVVSILSSSYDSKEVNKAKEFPVVNDYVVKPLTEEKVRELMQKHFGWNSESA